jgi:demethylmenaquinone methyltransferase/2-methoxy-6-polyprenyl-1,4-benzoquinol methylase
MSTLAYMKFLERRPETYDRRMRWLTLGAIDRIKEEIARRWVEPGHEVLEIGCGTGRLAALLCARGARVLGVDISEGMLELARRRAPQATFLRLPAARIGRLGRGRFDRIVATLVLSELMEEEARIVLEASRDLLRRGGRLVVADEARGGGGWRGIRAAIVRWPAALLTLILTQEPPRPARDLERWMAEAGLRVVHRKPFLAGALVLLVGEVP